MVIAPYISQAIPTLTHGRAVDTNDWCIDVGYFLMSKLNQNSFIHHKVISQTYVSVIQVISDLGIQGRESGTASDT